MPRPAERYVKTLLRGLGIAALTTLIGLSSTASVAGETSQTWSVIVHLEYLSGFVYEGTLAVGVPTSTLPLILSECASSHRFGSAATRYYYCYPVPE